MHFLDRTIGHAVAAVELLAKLVQGLGLEAGCTAHAQRVTYDDEGKEQGENEYARIQAVADGYRRGDGYGQGAVARGHSSRFPEKSSEHVAKAASLRAEDIHYRL